MLTMTTVGYGDFYPRTYLGRFTIVISCFWGIFLISLMVVTLTNSILFSNEESRSFDYMSKVKSLNTSKRYARLFIRAQLERYLLYRRHRADFKSHIEVANINILIKFYFKKFKEYQENAKFADVGAAEMLTVLNERISLQVKYINHNLHYAHTVHDNLTIAVSCQEKTKDYLDNSIRYLEELKRIF